MSDEEKIRPEEENHIGRHMAPTPPPAEEPVKAAGVPAAPEAPETAAPKAPETPKSPAAKSAKPAKKKPVRSVRTARPEKKPEPEPKKKKAVPQLVEAELDPREAERAYMPIRSRRDGRIGCMGGIMYAAFILCASVLLAVFGWMAASDVLALNKSAESVEITLPESAFTQKTVDVTDDDGNVTGTKTVRVADMNTVSGILKDYGLINYKWLFQLYSRFSNAEVQLSPGTYALTTNLDYRALVKKMQTGADSQLQTLVMFPEGYNLDQVFARLEENGVCSREDLYAAAANAEFSYTFLEGVETGDPYRLEGFLFPDTYYAERATIASVIYNRLNIGMPLQLDSTVVYAIRETGETTMSTELIQATDSPYNTYLYQGLPPGPICNPGMKSIEAALNPEQTGYYYFALDMETKSMRFFATLAEHEAFVATQDYG